MSCILPKVVVLRALAVTDAVGVRDLVLRCEWRRTLREMKANT